MLQLKTTGEQALPDPTNVSPEITERQGIGAINGNTFTLSIPKLTVAHIVLSNGQ